MVLAAAACFGILSIIVKLTLPVALGPGASLFERTAVSLELLAVRYFVAASILWVFLGIFRRNVLSQGRKHAVRIALIALVGYGFASVCFFVALTRISASLVALILYTYPTLVAIASVRLFDEPLTKSRVAALLMTFAGVGLAVWAPGMRIDLLGVLICTGAPVGYAAFSLLSYRWRMDFAPEAITAWGLPVAAVPVLILAWLMPASRGPVEQVASWSPTVWLAILAMALFPTIAAIGLYVRGMTRLGAPAAALASTFEPVVTLALAAALLGERLTPSQWLGAALVLAGVVVAELGQLAPRTPPTGG
jgi:drug/metabolite transporter (DMT)-like permease